MLKQLPKPGPDWTEPPDLRDDEDRIAWWALEGPARAEGDKLGFWHVTQTIKLIGWVRVRRRSGRGERA